jgi:hypothetical protein
LWTVLKRACMDIRELLRSLSQIVAAMDLHVGNSVSEQVITALF